MRYASLLLMFVAACGGTHGAQTTQAVRRGDHQAAVASLSLSLAEGECDSESLREVAASVLLALVTDNEADINLRRIALASLVTHRTSMNALLERESNIRPPFQYEVWGTLARRGVPRIRNLLRGMIDSTEVPLLREAVSSLDPEHDEALLLQLLANDDANVRRRAILAGLGTHPRSSTQAQLAIVERSRNDDDDSVRSAATRAFSRIEIDVNEELLARESDPSLSVRLAALDVLCSRETQLDFYRRHAAAFDAPSSPESLEIARCVLKQYGHGASGNAAMADRAAESHLYSALTSQNAQALAILRSLNAVVRTELALKWKELPIDPLIESQLALVVFEGATEHIRTQFLSALERALSLDPFAAEAARLYYAIDPSRAHSSFARMAQHESDAHRAEAARQMNFEPFACRHAGILLGDPNNQVRVSAAASLLLLR